MQSVSITTNAVSLKPAHGEARRISPGNLVSSTNITEILLKVALNTITLPPPTDHVNLRNSFTYPHDK